MWETVSLKAEAENLLASEGWGRPKSCSWTGRNPNEPNFFGWKAKCCCPV